MVYYNLNQGKIWIIDADNVLSESELSDVQKNLQSLFWIEIKTRRNASLPFDQTYNKLRHQNEAHALIQSDLTPKPQNNDYYIYLINRDIYAGEENSFYFAWTEYQQRTTILSLYRLKSQADKDSSLKDRVYKILLRRIGKLYGAGIDHGCKDFKFAAKVFTGRGERLPAKCLKECGVMKYSNSIGELDALYPFYCGEDIKYLQGIKVLKNIQ